MTAPVLPSPPVASWPSIRRRLARSAAGIGLVLLATVACTSTSSTPLPPPGGATSVPSVGRVEPSGTAPVSVSSSSSPPNNATEDQGGTQPPTSPVDGRPKTPDPAPAPEP